MVLGEIRGGGGVEAIGLRGLAVCRSLALEKSSLWGLMVGESVLEGTEAGNSAEEMKTKTGRLEQPGPAGGR